MKNHIASLVTANQFPTTAILLLFILLFNAFETSAQTGVLDVTFGNKGKVATLVGDSNAMARAVAIQADGKIVAAGQTSKNGKIVFALARYNANGTIDNSFGNGGKVTTGIGTGNDEGHAAAIQPDGKILVCGVTYPISNRASDFALVRYNPNGSVDSTFGNYGIVKTDFTNSYDAANSILIRSDGKILVGGDVEFRESDGSLSSGFGLVQYNSNGTFDNRFGINGKVFTKNNGTEYGVSTLGLQTDGKIVAGGAGFTLIRYELDGKVDSTFGTNGITTTRFYGLDDWGFSLTIQPDGTILFVGNVEDNLTYKENVALVRYKSNGSIDSTFGTFGKVITAIDKSSVDDIGTSVYVRPDGKILITGTTNSEFYYNYDPRRFNGNFALLRYNNNGSIDSTFGKRGIVTTDFFGFYDDCLASAIQRDGKIVLAGISFDGSNTDFGLARYESNGVLYYNTLKGSVFIDNNLNGIRDNEPFYSDAKITITKAGQDTIIALSNNGKFSTDIDTGLFATKVIPYVPYYTVVPASFNTSNATYFNTDSVSFALQPVAGKQDLKISLIPVTPARPGSVIQYRLAYRNQGTTAIPNATIQLVKNSKLDFLSASFNYTSRNGDTLRWEYSNVQLWETGNILINFQTGVPPLVNNNDTLRSVATIFPVNGDITPTDNVSSLLQKVVGSYDPNNKTESHAGSLSTQQVSTGDYLTYTIRFQNTGTDTAFNVHVKDTLAGNLDWSTFEMVSWSHNYQLTVNDNNKLSWAFNNINLPDSSHNEASSHGYIVYRVKPKTALLPGDTIQNTAGIYFDYNLPVATNTENTIVQSSTLPVTLTSFTVKREGQINTLQWSTTNEVNIGSFEIERSTDGRTFLLLGKTNAGFNEYAFTDTKPAKAINYYRLKMIDKDGKFVYSVIRTINNSGSFEAGVYPNPVGDVLSLKLFNENKTRLQLQIIDIAGKVLLTKQVAAEAAASVRSINVSFLRSGNYFVKITSLTKEQAVLKFEKL